MVPTGRCSGRQWTAVPHLMKLTCKERLSRLLLSRHSCHNQRRCSDTHLYKTPRSSSTHAHWQASCLSSYRQQLLKHCSATSAADQHCWLTEPQQQQKLLIAGRRVWLQPPWLTDHPLLPALNCCMNHTWWWWALWYLHQQVCMYTPTEHTANTVANEKACK